MAKSPALLVHISCGLLFTLVVLTLAISGCGASMMSTNPMPSARQMQGLKVMPLAADAQTFPGGQVQFTVTAFFSAAPMTVTSPAVLWSIGNPFPPPSAMPMSAMSASAPSITSNGLAQCNGFMGMVSVQATAPVDPGMPVSQMNSMTAMISGSAQLTCP